MAWRVESRLRRVWIHVKRVTKPSLQHAHRQTDVARVHRSIDRFHDGSAGLIEVRTASHDLKGRAGAPTMARLGWIWASFVTVRDASAFGDY